MKKRKKEGTMYPQFMVVSGNVRVTDPCYDADTWCSTNVNNVKNGTWNAFVKKQSEGMWGERCAELFVWHSDYQKDEVFGKITRKQKGRNDYDEITGGMGQKDISATIGVDSGQAGVFDAQFFKDDKSVTGVKRMHSNIICEDELWYSMCCDRTLSDKSWGVIPYGAVSSSGFGDGSYTAYKCFNNNKEVVGIRIVFI